MWRPATPDGVERSSRATRTGDRELRAGARRRDARLPPGSTCGVPPVRLRRARRRREPARAARRAASPTARRLAAKSCVRTRPPFERLAAAGRGSVADGRDGRGAPEIYVHDWCDPDGLGPWLYEHYGEHHRAMARSSAIWLTWPRDLRRRAPSPSCSARDGSATRRCRHLVRGGARRRRDLTAPPPEAAAPSAPGARSSARTPPPSTRCGRRRPPARVQRNLCGSGLINAPRRRATLPADLGMVCPRRPSNRLYAIDSWSTRHHHSAKEPSACRQTGLRQAWPVRSAARTASSSTVTPRPGRGRRRGVAVDEPERLRVDQVDSRSASLL